MNTNKIDFKLLEKYLLQNIDAVIPTWLPHASSKGAYYECGDLHGGAGKSLKINKGTGIWKDFASSDKGGDLISLYAAINQLSQIEAARALVKIHGPDTIAVTKDIQTPQSIVGAPGDFPLEVPPENMAAPSFYKKELGKPTSIYRYTNEQNQALFYICRYDHAKGKVFIPKTYSDGQWRSNAYPAPRPMYNLYAVAKNPDKSILIVEGEKAQEAAQKIMGNVYVVVTWSGGSHAVFKTDFKPLKNKKVLLWPDQDTPGIEAMQKLSEILLKLNCEVKIINVENKNDGKDAYDYLTEGMDFTKFKAWAKDLVVEVKPSIKTEEASGTPKNQISLLLSEKGKPLSNLYNIEQVLTFADEFKGKIIYDEFSYEIYSNLFHNKNKRWTDYDDSQLLSHIQGNYGLVGIRRNDLSMAVSNVSRTNRIDLVTEWLTSLKWDKTERIARCFIDIFSAEDNVYNAAVSKSFWLSLVARGLLDDAKVDTMVIFQGKQGVKKSTALSIIGGEWYCETTESPSSKDFIIALKGKLLVEIAELDSFNKSSATKIKQILTSQSDRIRLPYSIHAEDFRRRCVFAGTTNTEEFLDDETGARRFYPVKVGEINIEKLREEREQLFAEAVFKVLEGETWWDIPDFLVEMYQESFKVTSPLDDEIVKILLTSSFANTEITTHAIAKALDLNSKDLTDRKISIAIGQSMRRLGYIKEQIFIKGRRPQVWTKDTSKKNKYSDTLA